MRVELYTSYGCRLCKEAKRLLASVQRRIPFELVETDIRLSADLYARYRYDIPVLFVDGERAFTHRFTEEELEARLRGGTSVAVPDGGTADEQVVPATYAGRQDD